MAMQTKKPDLLALEGAVERWTEATRKAGNDYLDAYGKTVDQLAEYGESQARLSRNLADTYITVTRDLLKA
jgi:hypothetical protein